MKSLGLARLRTGLLAAASGPTIIFRQNWVAYERAALRQRMERLHRAERDGSYRASQKY